MFDPVAAQESLTALLAASESLATVNVKSYRAMRVSDEMDFRTIVTSKRAGKIGAGVLVAMPTAGPQSPNVSGPILVWTFPIVSMELPAVNFKKGVGTFLSAEELAQNVMDIVHHWFDERHGVFEIKGQIQPENEYNFPGVVAYRTNFVVLGRSNQTQRCGPTVFSIAAGSCTLSCGTAGSRVMYTTDGSFPSSQEAGSTSLYTAPFAVVTGDVVRAVAYADGMVPGPARYQVAT